jgi:hypothetical protein
MSAFKPPSLPTLKAAPSWRNARGELDRSACVEVRVSEIRRLAGCYQLTPSGASRAGRTRPLPGETPARRRFRATRPPRTPGRGPSHIIGERLASGVYHLDAASLCLLHDQRPPRTLAGDWRTTRAPAMRHDTAEPRPRRPPRGRDKFRFRTRFGRTARLAPFGLDISNPNKGAARTKRLGIDETWSQPIRLEKWSFPARIQPAYFLVCPGRRCQISGLTDRRNAASLAGEEEWIFAKIRNNAPPLSTRPPGRVDPHATNGVCPQRCLKLLMIQATPAEVRDAELARLWIDSLPPRERVRHHKTVAQLIDRYGAIFPPRVLLCPRCLGVRYGNDPETVRQGWRRRQGKPDAQPPRRGRVRLVARQIADGERKRRREAQEWRSPAAVAQRRQEASQRRANAKQRRELRIMRTSFRKLRAARRRLARLEALIASLTKLNANPRTKAGKLRAANRTTAMAILTFDTPRVRKRKLKVES